jgi:signal-transduction protein with cAMP-binding, CBS, and nucleotidyltransferase domain
MKIKDLKPRMPVTVSKNESLTSAAKMLADEEIGALVVFEPQGLAGVISERDIVRAVADGFDLESTEVCEYMTEAAVVAEETAAIGDAIAKMNDSNIRHIVVISDGDVSGMISMRDVVAVVGTDSPEL